MTNTPRQNKNQASFETLGSVQKSSRQRGIKSKLASFLIVASALVVVVWFCYTKFFLIKKCELKYEGNLDYTEEQVLQGAGLAYGMQLYALDKQTISENIVYNLPFIDSYELKRVWPNKVVFEIIPAVPSMYTVIGNNAFVLSQSLRVLSQTDDFSYIESNKLINVFISDIKSCVAGEYLQSDKDSADTAKKIYQKLCQYGIVGDVTEIDVSDRFDITFSYKKRYEVKLGDKRNLDMKIKFMIAIEEKLPETKSGIIDVSDENAKEGVVKSF